MTTLGDKVVMMISILAVGFVLGMLSAERVPKPEHDDSAAFSDGVQAGAMKRCGK